MNTKRFQLCLEQLKPSHWAEFEKLASVFLAAEFGELRTTASNSGDGGRDAELFSPDDDPRVVAQYSVAEDWQTKINNTVKRLATTFPDVLQLIYVSSQEIGAKGDELKRKLRVTHGLALDIRDRNWLCERATQNQARQIAAEEISCAIVDPLLSDYQITRVVPSELDNPESIAALVFLGLQWQDDVREKGLTKLAFDALVRAALIGSDSNNLVDIRTLFSRIEKVLPQHEPNELKIYVNAAIRRLGKHAVKSWPDNKYCLAHEESLRFLEFQAKNAIAEQALSKAIIDISERILDARNIPPTWAGELAKRIRTVTERVLLERSQSFAMAVQTGSLADLADTEFDSPISSELAKSTLPKIKDTDWLQIFRLGIREVLISDDQAIQSHLRSLADSYTLMAFLQQTPDVQRAVEKMFSHGNLWLDTTVILPLIADTLDAPDINGRFTRMIKTARDVGLKLYVTPGVVEEVERHMNRSLTCSRMPINQWEGPIPYLFERFIESGRATQHFASWLNEFRGDSRPIDDLSDYLATEMGIELRSLEAESLAASSELRNALQSIWLDRYARRQERYSAQLDDTAISRLVSHDIECYAGIVSLRTQERSSPFGYSAWWLTVDRQTFDLKNRLRGMMNTPPPDSPVMSADFLVNYLAIGPLRKKLAKDDESHLPMLMIVGSASMLTPEIMAQAEALREQFKQLPERLIRREVRDGLDRARAAIGPLANRGMDKISEEGL